MRKKIIFIEIFIVIILVVITVKGYDYWNKSQKLPVVFEPVLPEKIIADIIGDKESNLFTDIIEVKYYSQENPDSPLHEFTLSSSNNYGKPEFSIPPIPIIIKATSFNKEKEILLKVQQGMHMKVAKNNINLPVKNYRFILETYPEKAALGKEISVIAKLIREETSNSCKPTKNVKINFNILSGERILLETSKTTDKNGLCTFSFIPEQAGCITVKGEYYVKKFTYSNTCSFEVIDE